MRDRFGICRGSDRLVGDVIPLKCHVRLRLPRDGPTAVVPAMRAARAVVSRERRRRRQCGDDQGERCGDQAERSGRAGRSRDCRRVPASRFRVHRTHLMSSRKFLQSSGRPGAQLTNASQCRAARWSERVRFGWHTATGKEDVVSRYIASACVLRRGARDSWRSRGGSQGGRRSHISALSLLRLSR